MSKTTIPSRSTSGKATDESKEEDVCDERMDEIDERASVLLAETSTSQATGKDDRTKTEDDPPGSRLLALWRFVRANGRHTSQSASRDLIRERSGLLRSGTMRFSRAPCGLVLFGDAIDPLSVERLLHLGLLCMISRVSLPMFLFKVPNQMRYHLYTTRSIRYDM